MKKFKIIMKYVITFISIVIIFLLFLTCSNIIPNKLLKNNVSESYNELKSQGNFPHKKSFDKGIDLIFDNMTDALMINTAYSIDTKKPFYSGMVARKNYYPGKIKKIHRDSVGLIQSTDKTGVLNQTGDLKLLLSGKVTESFEYARYWHGYLVLLRPLLVLLNLGQIRFLFKIIFILLALIWIVTIYKKVDLETAIIFLASFIICDYFKIYNSIQVYSVFLIAVISSIILLVKKVKNLNIFFLIIGMLTCFFDFLTAPIITLGIPLITVILIEKEKQKKDKEYVKRIVIYSLFWVVGFLGTWIAKWILVDILYNRNIFKTSMEQLLYRTISSDLKTAVYFGIYSGRVSILNSLLRNFYIVKKPLIFLLSCEIIYFMVKCFDNKKTCHGKRISILLYFLISLMPIGWYLVFIQHSFCHPHYTYRNIWILFISLSLMLKELSSSMNVQKLVKKNT